MLKHGGTTHMTGGSWWMALGCYIKRDKGRRRRGGVKVMLCVKEILKCLEGNCNNCKTPIGCLWVKIRGGSYSGHLLPDQDVKPKKVIIGSLKQVSCQQNLVLVVTSTTKKNHISPWNVPGMRKMLLPQAHKIYQQGMSCSWTSYSQSKKTCFVLSRFMMALAALIAMLWSLRSWWACWGREPRQRLQILKEQVSACSELSWERFCGNLP